MPTPAERIYEATVDRLANQQARAERFTTAVTPVGATATAGALLLGPATSAIGHAQLPQIAGLAVGIVGMSFVFAGGILLLIGADIKGVQPKLLYETAEADGGPLSSDPSAFDLAAAADLQGLWKENRVKLKKVTWVFRVFVIGLVLELAGLGAAALIRPSGTRQTKDVASLHLTSGHLGPREINMTGELAAAAHGRVRIAVRLLGRTGEVMSLHPSIHRGHFKARIRVAPDVVPLRSASYSITWAGSKSVARARLAGTIARCQKDCQ